MQPITNFIKRSIWLWLLFTIFLQPAQSFSMNVEGRAIIPLEGISPLEAKEKGLEEALKSALLNAAALLNPKVDEKTLEKLTKDDRLSYIKSYRIAFENSEGKDYKVIIEVDVDSLRLNNRLESFRNPFKRATIKPGTVSVNVFSNDLAAKILPTVNIKGDVSSVLLKEGYRVKSSRGDVQINVFITLKPDERNSEHAPDQNPTMGSVWIKAVDKSGRPLAEINESNFFSDDEESLTAATVLREMAKGATEKLTANLAQSAPALKTRKGLTQIVFDGVTTYDQYKKIESMLSRSLLGTENIKRRRFGYGSVSFEVALKLDPENFVRIVTNLKQYEFFLRTKKVAQEKIVFSVVR